MQRFTVSTQAGQQGGKRFAVIDKQDRQGGKGARRVSFHRTFTEARAAARRLNDKETALTHTLTVYMTTFTDITEDGEMVNPDRYDTVIRCEPDKWDIEDGKSAVDIAAEYLVDESITQTSTSPVPATGSLQGLWFSYVDGSYISNHYSGERTEVSAHPEGFTDEELREMCTRLGVKVR